MSRWPDGLLPGYQNPRAIWEIKEHYHTTTFGSRVSASVYETLLDGREIAEITGITNQPIEHLVFIDGYKTWWVDGKPYLCRLIDGLHQGYLSALLFGGHVLTEFPKFLNAWAQGKKFTNR